MGVDVCISSGTSVFICGGKIITQGISDAESALSICAPCIAEEKRCGSGYAGKRENAVGRG